LHKQTRMSWTAEYEQFGTWHPMHFTNITLETLAGGCIQANGQDEVGQFTFEGTFSNT
jgi:hypothetical protein